MTNQVVKILRKRLMCVCGSNLFRLKQRIIYSLFKVECINCGQGTNLQENQYELFGNNEELAKVLYYSADK